MQGPFEIDALQKLAAKGKISRIHEASEDGHHWQSASSFPEIFAAKNADIQKKTTSRQQSDSSNALNADASFQQLDPLLVYGNATANLNTQTHADEEEPSSGTGPSVTLPASFLRIFAVAGTTLNSFSFALSIAAIITAISQTLSETSAVVSEDAAVFAGFMGLLIINSLLGVLFGVSAIIGLTRMMAYRNYRFAIFSIVLVMFPFINWWTSILAFPFGIWALIVMCNRKVRNRFTI